MSGRLKQLMTRVGHYFVGNGLAILSGIISYPILTRVLAPEDYGTMGLISSVLLVSVALGKLGVQNSIIRFHAEARTQGRMVELSSTFMAFALIGGGGAALLQALTAGALGAVGAIEASFAVLLALTAPMALFRTGFSFGMSFLRAEERTRAYNVIDVLGRYLGLALALTLVFHWIGGVRGFFTGLLGAEAITLIIVLVMAHRVTGWRPARPDPALLRQAIAFGVPLLAFELTSIVLAFGDRVLIKALASDVALGHYTAAYNLGDTLQKFLMMPLALAIQPAYMRTWAEEGAEATASFLSRAGALFFMISIPAIAGVAAVRQPLIELLAGREYLDGASVLPLTFGGFMLYGGYAVLAAGLFIKKETSRMALVVGLACLANLALNAALIPGLGIFGAAVATAVSYLGAIIGLTALAFRHLPFTIPWAHLGRLSAMAGIMYAAVFWIELGHPALTLAARVTLGGALMVGMAVGLDPQGRRLAREFLSRG